MHCRLGVTAVTLPFRGPVYFRRVPAPTSALSRVNSSSSPSSSLGLMSSDDILGTN